MKYIKYFLIAALAIFLLTKFALPAIKNNDSPTSTSNKQSIQKGSFAGTLKDAVAKNIPMKCESLVEGEDGAGTMSGIIQGNQYAGRISVSGKIANVLMKDNCMWNWQEGATSGIKTCFEPTEDGAEIFDNFDPQQLQENVKCMPTMIAPGTFSPPTNVTFLNMDYLSGDLTEEQINRLEEMSSR